MFNDIPKHKLIHDVTTCWNSTYDIIERVCEQQLATYQQCTTAMSRYFDALGTTPK